MPVTNPTLNVSFGGNTAGTLALASTGTLVLAGGNNITLSQNGNSVTVSGANAPAQSAFVFSDANGVSWGTNVSTVTATVKTDYQPAGAYLTTAAQSDHSHGNPTLALTNINGTTASASNGLTLSLSAVGGGGGPAIKGSGTYTQNTGTIEFANSNGVTFGLETNGTMTASVETNYQAPGAYLTTAALSNHNHDGVYQPVGAYLTTARASNDAIGLNTAATNVTWTVGSAGISIDAAGYQAAGAYLTTAALSNHNHDGVYQPVGAYLTTARASNDAIGLNTAATNVTWTVGSAGISLNAGGYQSAGAYLTTARASNDAIGLNTAATNVTWTVDSRGISLNAGAYQTFAHALVLSNQTSGATTIGTSGTVSLAGTNVTITVHNTNNSIIGFSVAAPGAAAVTHQSVFAYPDDVGNSSAWQVSGSTSHIQPINLPFPISIGYIRLPLTLSAVGSMASIATLANVTRGMTVSSTINAGFYTQNVVANSLSLASIATSSATWIQRATHQAAGVGSNWSTGHTISFPANGAVSQFTSSSAATLTNVTMQSSQLSNFTNLRFVDIPFATSLPAGNYWFLYGSSTSISTSGVNNFSTLRILASNFVITQVNQAFNRMGVATNASNHIRVGLGSWTTNTIGHIPNNIGLASISTSASHPVMRFQLIRQA
jgi:hypothetical protein